jgi:hypothetical protein
MSKTIIVPVGEPETLLYVTVEDQNLLNAAVNSGSTAGLLRGEERVPLRARYGQLSVDGFDGSLARTVGTLSILTGRNLRPDRPVPWGSVLGDGRLSLNTRADEVLGGSLHPEGWDVFDFLESTEADPCERYVLDVPTPPAVASTRQTRWNVCAYNARTRSYWCEDLDGDGGWFSEDAEDVEDAATFFLTAEEMCQHDLNDTPGGVCWRFV